MTGLAQGVVVVEAAKRSGSLISARLANEMGRLVLAVPGSPLDPRSEGTNDLIKQGATLITSTEDILEALTPLDPAASEFIYDINEGNDELPFEVLHDSFQTTDDTIRSAILASLGASPTEIDDIIRFTGAKPGQVQLVLMELALAGRLEPPYRKQGIFDRMKVTKAVKMAVKVCQAPQFFNQINDLKMSQILK